MSKKWGDTIIIHIGTLLWYQGCNKYLMRGVEWEDWGGVRYKYRLGHFYFFIENLIFNVVLSLLPFIVLKCKKLWKLYNKIRLQR